MEEGGEKGVRVASWLIKQQKPHLFCSLVGFLKSKAEGLRQTELWIEKRWGKMPDKVQMLGQQAVWIKLLSENDLEEFLNKAAIERDSSPFCTREMDGVYGVSPYPSGAKNSGSTPSCLG